MAFSLFSNRQSQEHTFPGKPSGAVLAARTMQDDLRSIESGERGDSSQSQVETGQYKPAGTPSGAAPSPIPVNPFSEEGEKLFQSQGKEAASPRENPFGVVPERANRPTNSAPSNFLEQPSLENGLRPLVQRGALLSSQPTVSKKLLLTGGIGVIAALFVLAGIGYFFFGSEEQAPETGSSADVIEKTSGIPENLTPKTSPFSRDFPNYLSFNTETVSPLDIQKTLSQAADRIKEAGIAEPIEFLITDQNNNPLAFSRFAFLLQFDLDSDLLALIDEAFSLYEYDDAGSVRLGLALTLRDAQAAAALIEKTESSLPYAFKALILESDVSVGKKLSFRSTNYNQFPVRFANIDSNRNISLDYALNNDQLFIGMSKNALRAILDANTK